jgi:metacaspase-1
MKKAFLVGVNRYVTLPNNCLNGCVNDVTNMRDILIKYFEFLPENIRVVIDDRATKANIVSRLAWLLQNNNPGDQLLFHYSGHGSQVRDRDGDELADGLDEIICPTDIVFDNTDSFITDDEFRAMFSNVQQGVNLEVLLDCCHSGTGTRELQAIDLLPKELQYKARYLAPPLDILLRDSGGLPVKPMLKNIAGNGEANPTTHTLFSGCMSNQTSADAYINGSYNGAFTFYLCKHIRETQGTITRQELIRRLNESLSFNGYSQQAQLECSEEKQTNNFLM